MTEPTNQELWNRIVALSDRIADLERRANIDHLSDSPITNRDGIASVASLSRVAIEGTRERRQINERIADLERRANTKRLSDSPPPHYDRYWRIALPSYMVAALEGEQS